MTCHLRYIFSTQHLIVDYRYSIKKTITPFLREGKNCAVKLYVFMEKGMQQLVCRGAEGMWVTGVRPHQPPQVQIKHHRRHQWVTFGCVTLLRAMNRKEAAAFYEIYSNRATKSTYVRRQTSGIWVQKLGLFEDMLEV
jgi:hypothetical protein